MPEWRAAKDALTAASAYEPRSVTSFIAKRDLSRVSLPVEVQEGQLKVVMDGLAATGNVDGLSSTTPRKITGVQFRDTLSEASKRLGVVSAIRRNKDGSFGRDTPLMVTLASRRRSTGRPGAWLENYRDGRRGCGQRGADLNAGRERRRGRGP